MSVAHVAFVGLLPSLVTVDVESRIFISKHHFRQIEDPTKNQLAAERFLAESKCSTGLVLLLFGFVVASLHCLNDVLLVDHAIDKFATIFMDALVVD